MRASMGSLLLLLGCASPGDDVSAGILGTGPLDVFPNASLVVDGRLALQANDLPGALSGLPLATLDWRAGFSRGQVMVVDLPDVHPGALPALDQVVAGQGSVLLVDLGTGMFYPVFAELDAHADEGAVATLVLRPQVALPLHARMGVIITTDAAPRPERFHEVVRGGYPDGFEGGADRLRSVVTRAVELGVERERIALAWDFPIEDGTAPLRTAMAQIEPPGDWVFDHVRELDAGDAVSPGTWRAAEGRFAVQTFLEPDGALRLDDDGAPQATGVAWAELFVLIPESVRDAPERSVPVLFFGHDLHSTPAAHLDGDFVSAAQYVADRNGVIVLATRFRGMGGQALPLAAAARDPSLMHTVPHAMAQGLFDARALIAMVRRGELLDDPVFAGAQGQALVDRQRLHFYGIGLGAMAGAVLTGSGAPLDALVLEGGGSLWTTTLERSALWAQHQPVFEEAMPIAAERQRALAVAQLLFDPVDPINYVEGLREVPLLLHEAVGDDWVCNQGTRALARSIGLPLLAPPHSQPEGFGEPAIGPLPGGSSAYVQFDPMLGLPNETNAPAQPVGAHGAPEAWVGSREQVRLFLQPEEVGRVEHFCGDDVCSQDNIGELGT